MEMEEDQVQNRQHEQQCLRRANLWNTRFYRQAFAFDAIDNNVGLGGPALRAFAAESPNSNGRTYLSIDYETLWFYYVRCPEDERHLYEIVREGSPCKLFFDLEFDRNHNEGLDEMLAMQTFYNRLIQFIRTNLGRETRREDFLELDSSSQNKFSRHIIWAKGSTFENVNVLKAFVHRFVEEMGGGPLFCMTNDGEWKSIIDKNVYTKNRNFRLFLSSKATDRTRVLRISPYNVFVPIVQPIVQGMETEKAFFLASLILNVNNDGSRVISLSDLPFAQDSSHMAIVPARPYQLGNHQALIPGGGRIGNLTSTGAANSLLGFHRSYPKMVNFFDEMLSNWSVGPFRFRNIPRFYPDITSNIILINFDGYRFCERIGRHHKRNNIYLLLDTVKEVWYQKCQDSDCRGFKSIEREVHSDVMREIFANCHQIPQ